MSATMEHCIVHLVVLIYIMLLSFAGAKVSIVSSVESSLEHPDPSLRITCNFTYTGYVGIDSAELISLSIAKRYNSSQNFQDLVSINPFHPEHVEQHDDFHGASSGQIEPKGSVSFLEIRYQNPTSAEAGEYECAARFMDKFGHVSYTADSVKVEPELLSTSVLLEKLQKLQRQHDVCLARVETLEAIVNDTELRLEEALTLNNVSNENLEFILEQWQNQSLAYFENEKACNATVKELEKNIESNSEKETIQNGTIKSLETTLAHVKSVIVNSDPEIIAVSDSFNYSIYLLTNVSSVQEIVHSVELCRRHGGYIVEVNSEEEFFFLGLLLKNSADSLPSSVQYLRTGAMFVKIYDKWTFIAHRDDPMYFGHWKINGEATSKTNNTAMMIGRENDQTFMTEMHSTTSTDGVFVCEIDGRPV